MEEHGIKEIKKKSVEKPDDQKTMTERINQLNRGIML